MKELLRVPNTRWHPDKTILCGQIFHWYQTEDARYLVRGKEALQVKEEGDTVVFSGHTDDLPAWLRFLGLAETQDLARYENDPVLKEALDFARGLRLLTQDPFVTIISFILSANNHFARIRTAALAMAAHWGEPVFEGIHAFPSPERLAEVSPEELRRLCNTGYRDRYIADTARRIAEGTWDLQKPYALSTEDARAYLMQLPGVGPKVCDCILLFAYGKGDTFPVDVWMHRVMTELYPEGPAARAQIAKEAIARFGDDAGLLQQMLFYYAKAHKLGAKKKI